MVLYSGQGFDMRTFREPIDFAKGTYRARENWKGMDNVRRQQLALIERVGHNQFITCSTEPLEKLSIRPTYRFEHVLEVDAGDILYILRGWIWQYLIHGEASIQIPSRVHSELYGEFDAINLSRNRDWIKKNASSATYDNLLRSFHPQDEIETFDDVLVRWPFSADSRIVSVLENDHFREG